MLAATVAGGGGSAGVGCGVWAGATTAEGPGGAGVVVGGKVWTVAAVAADEWREPFRLPTIKATPTANAATAAALIQKGWVRNASCLIQCGPVAAGGGAATGGGLDPVGGVATSGSGTGAGVAVDIARGRARVG